MLIVAVLAVALFYGLADRTPADYREALHRVTRLTELAGRTDRTDLELPRPYMKLYGDFSEHGGAGKPFAFRITADEVNICLAAMDEIASWSSAEPVHVKAELAKAGFSGPAVAMDDGVLTLMVESTEHKKVVSVDLAFVFNEQGNVRMEILAMRVGVLPVPKAMLVGNLKQLRRKLQDLLGRSGDAEVGRFGSLPAKHVAKFLRAVVSMLDGAAIRPEVLWKAGAKHRVLIKKIEITDGELTLHFAPVSSR